MNDINQQRAEVIANAKAEVMKLVETCGDSLYDDDDFTGDAALYVDVDEPPSDADMGKPVGWERPAQIYRGSQVVIHSGNEQAERILQGEVGDW